jgi:curved DNA-binding protein CbpA
VTPRHPIDYYKTLGVERTASAAEIKRAYRALAQRYHPDVNPRHGAEVRFKEINAAYGILSDPQQRRKYDLLLGVTGQGMSDVREPVRHQGTPRVVKVRLDLQVAGISLTLGGADELRADLKRMLSELAHAIEQSMPD